MWGGASTPTEIATLLRATCSAHLAARRLEIARHELEAERPEHVEAPPHATSTNMGPMLREDTAWLGAHVPPRRRWVGWLLGIAVLVAAVIAVWAGTSSREKHPLVVTEVPKDAASVSAPDATERPDAQVDVVSESPTEHPPPKRPKPRAHAQPRSRTDASAATPATAPAAGALSIDARPSARIYIDGTFVDETPLYEHPLSAGKHELRLVPSEGPPRVRQIAIEPGRVLVIPAAKN